MAMSGKRRAGKNTQRARFHIGTRQKGYSKSMGQGMLNIPPFKNVAAKGAGKTKGRKRA